MGENAVVCSVVSSGGDALVRGVHYTWHVVNPCTTHKYRVIEQLYIRADNSVIELHFTQCKRNWREQNKPDLNGKVQQLGNADSATSRC